MAAKEPEEEPQAAEAAKKKGKKAAGPRGARLAKLQKAAEEDSAEEEPAEEEEEKPKRGKSKARRLQEDEESEEEAEERGVVKLSQLPKGMDEPAMLEYFAQFGEVTRLRVSRGKRFLASRGYGWVEFKQREVADIVAKTMDKYMLWGKVLEAKLLAPEEVHRYLFARHWQVEKPREAPARINRKKAIFLHNERPKTVEDDGELIAQRTFQQVRNQQENLKKLKGKLEHLGIDYDLGPFLAVEEENEEFQAAMAEFGKEQEAKREAEAEKEAAREAKREERKKKKEAAAKEEGEEDAEDAPAEEEAAVEEAAVEEAAPAKERKGKKREAEAAEAAPAKASKKRRKAA